MLQIHSIWINLRRQQLPELHDFIWVLDQQSCLRETPQPTSPMQLAYLPGLLSHFYTTEPRLKSLPPPSKMCAQRCGRYRPLPKQDPRQTGIQPHRVSLHLSLPYSSATRLLLCLLGASLSLHWLGLSWTQAGLCLGVSALTSSVDQGDVNSLFGPNAATQGTQPPQSPVGDTHLLLQASAPVQLDSLV